jgi:hypothetical protein
MAPNLQACTVALHVSHASYNVWVRWVDFGGVCGLFLLVYGLWLLVFRELDVRECVVRPRLRLLNVFRVTDLVIRPVV